MLLFIVDVAKLYAEKIMSVVNGSELKNFVIGMSAGKTENGKPISEERILKNLAIITVLCLVTATQAFADRGLGRRIVDNIVDTAVDHAFEINDRGPRGQKKLELHIGKKFKGFNVIKLKQQLQMQHPLSLKCCKCYCQ